MSNQEQEFIQRALANVEKAEKRMRIKQFVVRGLVLGTAILWAFSTTGPGLSFGVIVLAVVGSLLVCTTKILTLMNTNTKVILQAMADLRASIK